VFDAVLRAIKPKRCVFNDVYSIFLSFPTYSAVSYLGRRETYNLKKTVNVLLFVNFKNPIGEIDSEKNANKLHFRQYIESLR